MQIRDLYAKYHVMPQLQTHMLRVAGVGKIVAESWKNKCDTKFTTDLCLIHDMGNIVKFDLVNTNDGMFGKIENVESWQKIQAEYRDKYGKDAHDATIGILTDAGLSQFESYINEEETLYFAEASEEKLAEARVESIILMYSDCRVTPSGVVSYRERVNDLKDRYGTRSKTWYDWTFWFDEWIQKQVEIDLGSITEASVLPLFDELLSVQI